MTGNYTFPEYMVLIAAADSRDELQLLDGLLQEDRKNKLIDVFQYIDLKSAWVIRLTEISADEAERNMF